jgi:hypothetical protein
MHIYKCLEKIFVGKRAELPGPVETFSESYMAGANLEHRWVITRSRFFGKPDTAVVPELPKPNERDKCTNVSTYNSFRLEWVVRSTSLC